MIEFWKDIIKCECQNEDNNKNLCGSKIVLRDNFRQICSIVKIRSRNHIIKSLINYSKTLEICTVWNLLKLLD